MEGKDSMVREYLNGKPVSKIAEENNITREAVYLRLRTLPNWKNIAESKHRARIGEYLNKYKNRTTELHKLGEEGLSMLEMSKKTKIPYNHVRKLLKGTQFDNAHATSKGRNKDIRRLHSSGWSRRKLAKKYELSYGHICRIIRKGNE